MKSMFFPKPTGSLNHAVIFLVILFFALFSGLSNAQQVKEGPIVALQRNLFNELKAEKDSIEADCGIVFKRSLADIEQATSYFNCAMERLRTASLRWGERNREIVDTARDQMLQLLQQQIPAGESTLEQRQNLIRATTYTHSRLRNWHQSMGKLIEQLFQARFLTKHAAQSLLDELNESLSEATESAKGYVQTLQSEQSLPEERLRELSGAFNEKMFSKTKSLLSAFQLSLLVEKDRIMRQFEQDLDRHREEYREVLKIYDELLDQVFDALLTNAQTLWDKLQTQDNNTQ